MILTFDCSISGYSIGLFQPHGEKIAEIFNDDPFSHTEHLVPDIQSLLQSSAVNFSELTQIVTTKGPGSFTGIRVGLAAAAGLSAALSIPVVTVNTLLTLAVSHHSEMPIHVALDTKCGDVYYQSFQIKDKQLISTFQAEAITLNDALKRIGNTTCITHPSSLPIFSGIKNIITNKIQPEHVLSASHLQATHDLHPLYIRPVNAKHP